LDRQTDQLRTLVARAHQQGMARALFVYDSDQKVEVWADARVVLSRAEEAQLKLANTAWRYFGTIFWPIVLSLIAVVYFVQALFKEAANQPYVITDYAYYIDPPPELGISTTTLLYVGGAIVVLVFLTVVAASRFRAQCIAFFKLFLILDFFVIFAAGTTILLPIPFADLQLPVDVVTFSLMCWNFAACAVGALYLEFPESVQRFFLVVLNVIMAVMLLVTLNRDLTLGVVAIVAIADVVAMVRPDLSRLTPFILPANVQLLYETPRVLFSVGGLRIRTADMMLYGLMAGVVANALGSVVSAILVVCLSVAVAVFVGPFTGKFWRPLPLAFVLIIFVTTLMESLVVPFQQKFILRPAIL
jgi:hypothetical protein